MNVAGKQNWFIRWMYGRMIHYNEKKYWKRRKAVIDPKSRVPKLIRLMWLRYIKKCDAFNCASLGTNLGTGAQFMTPPILPHNLNGIVIGYKVTIGANCTICQRVTIQDEGNTVIGDNVFIGAGAFIAKGVKIGNNVIIGANAVVTHDLPDNVTAVGVPAKIITPNK